MSRKSLTVPCAAAAALWAMAWNPAFAGMPMPTVSGKTYVDLTYLDMSSDGTKTSNTGAGVDVKRFYFGATEKFDSIWSANITTDFNYKSSDGETQLFIKKAYVQATFSPAFYVQLGSANTPWIPFDEGVYHYRYVENTLIDRLHFGNSADWGLHVGGKLDNGLFSYALAAVNGHGYKNPSRSKDVDFTGRVSFMPLDGLTFAVGGYSGKLGQNAYGTTTYHTATRFDALVTYIKSGLRVGVEYFAANNWNNVTTVASDKADGTSIWASYKFTPLFGAFARWDQAKTSKDILPGLKDEYFNVGLEMYPRKNVRFSLVYKHEKVNGGGFVNTSYGELGGTREGKANEIGIWGRVAF